eukprot:9446919-Pyramimonas_sp.AAC.1
MGLRTVIPRTSGGGPPINGHARSSCTQTAEPRRSSPAATPFASGTVTESTGTCPRAGTWTDGR